MKILILLLFVSTSFGQENFGMREKVNSFAEKEVRKILTDEFIRRLDKYKQLESNPKEYYNSLGLTAKEKETFLSYFPKALKENLPKITLNKAGLITLTYKDETAHFSFSDLSKNQIYIQNTLVKLPTGDIKNFTQYFNMFNENMYQAFSNKTTFIKVLNIFSLVPSVQAESEYLNIPDRRSVPHYYKEGWDKEDDTPSLYKEEEEIAERMFGFRIRHNIKQTKQVLLAAVMAINSDLELKTQANYENKKIALPNNLRILYNRIGKMAKMCDSERIETGGKFKEGSEATKMLTALELVNEKINRMESLGKSWFSEIDELIWMRTSMHFTPNVKSFNICKIERIREMYEDKNLCDNMNKLAQCLIDFRTSGKVSNTRLTDEQMDLVIDNPGGLDHGQDEILRWIQEK